MKKDLVFVGDVHGEFRRLIWNATERYKLSNVNLFVLGDFGIGFDKVLKRDYQRALKKMEKYDIEVYTIRGNHDDPSWFDGLHDEFPRIHFLPDHQVVTLSDISIYCIGGGASTDISFRESGKDWWPGEYIVEKPIKDLPGKVDVIVSHEAPLAFEPVLSRFPETPEEQYYKILSGREYLSKVLQEVRCNYWFYGHYHRHYSGSYGNIIYRGLGILEFFPWPYYR